MGFRNVVSDGTSNPPRLRLQIGTVALGKLPRDGAEWSLAERLDRLASAEFAGIEAHCQTAAEAEELSAMLRQRGLGAGFQAVAAGVDDLLPAIELAHRLQADYLTAQVPGSLRAAPEIAALLKEMRQLVNDAGLPFFVETCRSCVTQDLRRTVKVIRRFGKVRFSGDFSHYVLAGELAEPWSEEIWRNFGKIAKRCGAWHGRVSQGEQIQNDIGDGSGEMAQQFKRLWTLGISAWLKKSRPGDVLPFTCQLDPPPYAMVDAGGREISDRWEQCLVIKRLAQEAWSDAHVALAATAEPEMAPVTDAAESAGA
jgi:sugar phosphate isomerase/epimerase